MKSVLILTTELIDNSESLSLLLVSAMLVENCINTVTLNEGSGEAQQVLPLETQNTHTRGGGQSIHVQTWATLRLHRHRYTTHHPILSSNTDERWKMHALLENQARIFN